MTDPSNSDTVLQALSVELGFISVLEGLLQRNTLNLTGNSNWDIDTITVLEASGLDAELRGSFGVSPLLVRLYTYLSEEPGSSGSEVAIAVMATHKDLNAQFPETETEHDLRHGNPALIARALACVIVVARFFGLSSLVARPNNAQLANHYRRMGFQDREQKITEWGTNVQFFDLSATRALRRAANFIQRAHEGHSDLVNVDISALPMDLSVP